MQKPRIKKYLSGMYICGRLIGDRWERGRGAGWSPKEAYDDWVAYNQIRITSISPSALNKDNCKSQVFPYGSGHVFKVVGSDDLTLWQKIKRWWSNEI